MVDLNIYRNCFELFNKAIKIVVCQERQSKYVIHNNSQYLINKIKFDNCIKNDFKKCDYLVEATKPKDKQLFLVELKGKNISEAIRQLNSTLDQLKISGTSGYSRVYGRITPSQTPNIRTTEMYRLSERFGELGGNLKCKTVNEDII